MVEEKRSLKYQPLQEITLRKYELPQAEPQEELVRKFMLSIGLLQPGDSRDIIVDVLNEILKYSKQKQYITFDQLSQNLKDKPGASAPNLRRQIRRLKELRLIEEMPEGFRTKEFLPLSKIFDDEVKRFILQPTLERINEYLKRLDETNVSSSLPP